MARANNTSPRIRRHVEQWGISWMQRGATPQSCSSKKKKKPSLVSPPFSHCQSLHYLISHFLMRMHSCAVLLLGAGTLQSMRIELKRSLLPAGWCREVQVMLTSFMSVIL